MGFKRMALLQPMIKELQEKYQGAELQSRMMKLYAKYGINPLAGCWPALVQLPFFFWVFYCMNAYRFEFQSGFFLWVNPETAKMMPGILAPNLGERDIPLVILYGISMIVSTMVTPVDPQNAKQTRMIGIIMAVAFTGIMLMPFAPFPSAFVVYWIGINVLSTAQSIYLSRRPIPPLVEIPESERKKGGMFGGLTPTDGPAKNGNDVKPREKTGAPKLHKPKKKKK
jgi:YidC/Oxa1 family membrane protein insertase